MLLILATDKQLINNQLLFIHLADECYVGDGDVPDTGC